MVGSIGRWQQYCRWTLMACGALTCFFALGGCHTAHSLNPVPCVYVSENTNAVVENGRLADVAPTILKLMGLEAPKEMTGKVLVK